jgi:hypothetical protein
MNLAVDSQRAEIASLANYSLSDAGNAEALRCQSSRRCITPISLPSQHRQLNPSGQREANRSWRQVMALDG